MEPTNSARQHLVAGVTGGAAFFHYADSLGIDRQFAGHVAPLASFVIGWIWAAFWQETFGRIDLFRLQSASKRRILDIDKELESKALSAARKRKLLKERDDCSEIVSSAFRHDLRKRMLSAAST